MAVHVLLNRKGGVGKSTLTMNLAAVKAYSLTAGEADADSRVAAISIDPQGSAEWWAARAEESGNELPFTVAQVHNNPELLAQIGKLDGIDHVYVDTPGWSNDDDPDDASVAAMDAVMSAADLLIVPMTPEGMCFEPTAHTIESVVKPSGLPFVCVINAWDPRDGTNDLNETRDFINANGWPLARTVIRRYKVHTRAAPEGLVCTEYPANRIALQARQDFMNLALELADWKAK